MARLEITQLPVLQDNYIYILRDTTSGETGVVDPAVADAVIDYLESEELSLNYILNTHHHMDHVGANRQLKETYGCTVIGPGPDQARIPAIDLTKDDGDCFNFGNLPVEVLFTPGHTKGHIVYHFPQDNALFCGDTLFAMGCGRLFEGTPEQMWTSLKRIRSLPDDTLVYCAHEYTVANGQFAITVDPDNAALKTRLDAVMEQRQNNLPTVPFDLGVDKATNPFLRADDNALAKQLDLDASNAVVVFATIRQRKDNF